MLRTLKLTISYDGTNYAGWQRQINGLGIQQVLEDEIEAIVGAHNPLNAAGRTDVPVVPGAVTPLINSVPGDASNVVTLTFPGTCGGPPGSSTRTSFSWCTNWRPTRSRKSPGSWGSIPTASKTRTEGAQAFAKCHASGIIANC